ncbi:MAG: DeoR family transcriptional regulator [Aggregatilineales bacterium]
MNGDENNLLAVERQAIIRRLLEREGVVRNTALKELLGVSPATIRADLRELQNSGVCQIVWGGAISKHAAELHSVELPLASSDPHYEAKRRIGARSTAC